MDGGIDCALCAKLSTQNQRTFIMNTTNNNYENTSSKSSSLSPKDGERPTKRQQRLDSEDGDNNTTLSFPEQVDPPLYACFLDSDSLSSYEPDEPEDISEEDFLKEKKQWLHKPMLKGYIEMVDVTIGSHQYSKSSMEQMTIYLDSIDTIHNPDVAVEIILNSAQIVSPVALASHLQAVQRSRNVQSLLSSMSDEDMQTLQSQLTNTHSNICSLSAKEAAAMYELEREKDIRGVLRIHDEIEAASDSSNGDLVKDLEGLINGLEIRSRKRQHDCEQGLFTRLI